MSRNKRFMALILGVALVFTFCACSETPSTPEAETPRTNPPVTSTPNETPAENGEQVETTSKILIAYFSKTGNTQTVADMITAYTGGTDIQIDPVVAYPENYNETVDIARKEQDDDARPEIASIGVDIADYDIIFLGYPNWWGTMPMVMFTFLENYDFSGKTIIPFCTHAGSGLGKSEADIAKLLPNVTLLTGLAVSGNSASGATADVETWIDALEIIS